MLPEFDERGNLPPGIHHAAINEVVERFSVLRSPARQSRTRNLEEFYDFIKDFAVGIYIDGSYTTSKLAPDDVDILVVLPSDFDFQSPTAQRLLRFIRNKKTNFLHIFVFVQSRDDQQLQDAIDWFTEDRQRNPKGIIYVEMRK